MELLQSLVKTFITACHRVASSIIAKLSPNIVWGFPGRLELTGRSDMHHRVLPHSALCTGSRRLWTGAGTVQQLKKTFSDVTLTILLTSPYCEKPETTDHFSGVENRKSHGTIPILFS